MVRQISCLRPRESFHHLHYERNNKYKIHELNLITHKPALESILNPSPRIQKDTPCTPISQPRRILYLKSYTHSLTVCTHKLYVACCWLSRIEDTENTLWNYAHPIAPPTVELSLWNHSLTKLTAQSVAAPLLQGVYLLCCPPSLYLCRYYISTLCMGFFLSCMPSYIYID